MTNCQSDDSHEILIEQAAKQIEDADFLLIATGAGFSADSGLPTYADVARNPTYESLGIEYGDLCRIQCLNDNPRLFYGFWGTCFNLYQRQVQPHLGYNILSRWCQQKQSKLNDRYQIRNDDNNHSGMSAYYLYTSNVDGHFRLAGFPEEKLHEVHGAIDKWIQVKELEDQRQDDDKTTQSTNSKVEWISVPDSYSFQVNPTTLEGPPPESILHDFINDYDKLSLQTNTSFVRPAVLMFDDGFDSHKQMGLDKSCDKYQIWEERMEIAMEASTDQKLVVLEIGCGTRVPSVRIECQDVISDTAKRINSKEDQDNVKAQRCCFIRINPDHEEIQVGKDVPENVTAISIRGTALDTILRIEQHYKGIA